MKTLSATLIITLVLLLGCDTTSDFSLNNPENDFSKLSICVPLYENIPLPNKSPLWQDSVFTVSQVIDGWVGGRMNMEKYYISDMGDSVLISADLKIPPGAFKGTETITITLDNNYAAFHFYPAMTFMDTLKFFQGFEGLNLGNYPTGTFDFVFISDDGSTELIKKNGVQVIVPTGTVRVQNAKLLHFSRYGWIRKFEIKDPDQ
jgi:hypothetical protein